MIRDAVATIPDDPNALREALLTVIAERDSRIAQLTAKRDEAIRQLRLHLSKRFGPRIEKLSPGQLSLFDDEVKAIDQAAAAEDETVQFPATRDASPDRSRFQRTCRARSSSTTFRRTSARFRTARSRVLS